MKPAPSHDEIGELLPGAALGVLDSADAQEVLAHLATCADCTERLNGYRDLIGALTASLPSQELSPHRAAALRARLLARAKTEGAEEVEASQVRCELSRTSRTIILAERWSGWMVAAALAALLLNHHAIHRPLDYGWLVAGVLAIALAVIGVYAGVQRRRVLVLERRLAALERPFPE